MMNAIDRLIQVAEGEIGYLEKKSNKDLDSKTANAGSGNYTKYNRDMRAWAKSASLSDQWCQNFVDWCFVTAFGLDPAKKLIYTFTNYTPTGSSAFKKKDRYIKRGAGKPKRGDVIYFYSSAKGRIGHVGIVYKVTSSTVYTIEGNTSGASTLVTNGGGVRKKSYSLKSSYIDGYGSVDYSAIEGVEILTPTPEPVLRLGDRLLTNGCEGDDVKALQTALIRLGHSCGSYGVDGEFGDCTEMALRAFQAAHHCEVDGEYGPESHAALTAALEALDEKQAQPDPDEAKHVLIDKDKKCYIRKGPGTEYKAMGVAHGLDRYPYQGQTYENGWHLIEYRGKNACVSGKYAKLVK